MTKVKEFAAFVKENKLEEFVTSNLTTLRSFNIPLFALLKDIGEADMRNQTRENLVGFLNSVVEGHAIDLAKEKLREWEADELPGIPKTAISVTDIVQIYAAQKIALLTFIPLFTTDSSVAVDIVFELESYYSEVRALSLEMLKKIEQEERLKFIESEERYKDLFDNASDLIHIVNPDGQIIYVNNAWLKSLKYHAEELKGKQIIEIIAEQERDAYLKYRQRVMDKQPDPGGISTILVTKEGEHIAVEGYVSGKFKDGELQYTRGILRDVTKRKEDELKLQYYNEQLREREDNLQRLIENAPDAIIVINDENIIQLWNPKAETTFGWKSEEVINTNLTETIVPEELRVAHNSGMKRYKATGVSHVLNRTLEMTALNKQRKRFFISLTISQSRQGGNNVFIAFIRDITAQKQNQAELENKRKQLEKSNEELGQYAWLASHDLKEPLRKIMTFSDILLTRYAADLPDDVKKHLNKIHHSTKRMDSLIEAIMVYSNVTDNDELFEETDLAVIVGEVLVDLEIAIKTKNAVIKVDPLPKIEAIKIQMRQLFQNLISNALKYNEAGTAPLITVTSNIKDGICHIEVSDNGIGFNNQYSEKIFQVFQRLSTGEKYEGTGIGLALCKKIMDTHQGEISAQSHEGHGTVFSLRLPLVHSSQSL